MKIHFEATESRHHEGSETLLQDEAAAYRALTTDEERTEWLRRIVVDLVGAGDHEEESQVEDGWHAYIEEDE